MKKFSNYLIEKMNKLEFEWALSSNANIQGGATFDFIVEDLSIESVIDETEKSDIYKNFIKNSDAPFKNEKYDFFTKNPKLWNIKDHQFLSDGFEISSPIKQVHELLNDIEDMFFWIDDVGSTTIGCNFDVHLSTIKKNKLDPIKLLMFVEENIILKHFEETINEKWPSSKYFLKQNLYTKESLFKIINKNAILNELKNKENVMGIRIVDIENNHVEFKYMGGANYHKNFNEVKTNIAKYSHWLEIATNPEYKRKEYLKKITRVMNKIRLAYLDNMLSYAKEWKSDKNLHKKLKPYKQEYKVLNKLNKGKEIMSFPNANQGLEDFFKDLVK